MDTVIFATTVFDEADNGPAIFARYLWEEFKDCRRFNFVLLAPKPDPSIVSPITSSVIFRYARGNKPSQLYENLEEAIDRRLGSIVGDNEVLLHLNIPHSLSRIPKGVTSIVQANDYDAAVLSRDIVAAFKTTTIKRMLALYWRRFREKGIFEAADVVLANSKYTAEILSREYKIRGLLEVIYKSVDIELFSPTNNKLTESFVSGATLRMLFVGSNWKRKGLDLLLQCLERLSKERYDFSLVIVGPTDFANNQKYVERVGRSSISKQVEFVGRVSREKMPSYYWSAHVAILPSRSEALGVAVVEALAAGVPVVASNAGGIPEILAGSGAGLVFENGDANDLEKKLVSIFENEGVLNRLNSNTLRTAASFSRSAMVKNILNVYSRYLSFNEA